MIQHACSLLGVSAPAIFIRRRACISGRGIVRYLVESLPGDFLSELRVFLLLGHLLSHLSFVEEAHHLGVPLLFFGCFVVDVGFVLVSDCFVLRSQFNGLLEALSAFLKLILLFPDLSFAEVSLGMSRICFNSAVSSLDRLLVGFFLEETERLISQKCGKSFGPNIELLF